MRSIRWEVVGFARDIKNLIGIADFDPVTNQDVFGNVPGTVRVRGVEGVVDAAFTPDLSGSFSYTRSQAKDSTHLQIRRVPEQLVKAAIDYHPINSSFGLFASVSYVGNTFETVAGVGRNTATTWWSILAGACFSTWNGTTESM